MIDLAYHVAAKKFGHAPTDARDALRILAEEGIIEKERLAVILISTSENWEHF